MARIRTIKPELWSDPEFVECSPNARLLLVAGLNFASDYGVLPDKPKQLKMQCFPADSVDIDALIDELIEHQFWVRRVAPDGSNVLVIRTFSRHQKVDKPTPGRWGDPDEWPPNLPDPSPNGRRALGDDSRSAPPRKGREGKGREHSPSTTPPLALVVDEHGAGRPFEEFWSHYPRKVSKADARKLWGKLRPDEQDCAIAAVQLQVRQWLEHERRTLDKIMHPDRWLRGRHWDDDVGTSHEQQQHSDGAVWDPYTQAWIDKRAYR